MLFRLAILCLILSLGACAREPLRSTQELTVVESSSLPPPTRQDLAPEDRPSLIGPLDVISVDVFGVPELTREVQVDLSGNISMPLIGEVDARGRTPQELSQILSQRLQTYVRNPDVTVNLKTAVSQVVTVDGQVMKPGLYSVTNQMTLLRAIASAQGLTEFARTDDVVILRTVGDQRMAGLYNIAAIRRGAYVDPPIYANDVIIVGDSPARRLFKDIVSTAPLIAAPLVAILPKL